MDNEDRMIQRVDIVFRLPRILADEFETVKTLIVDDSDIAGNVEFRTVVRSVREVVYVAKNIYNTAAQYDKHSILKKIKTLCPVAYIKSESVTYY